MKCDKKDLLLYAVTDRHWLEGRTLYEVVKESLDGGATFIQLREKNLDEESFLQEAKEIQKLCKEYSVPFVINDNVDIAKEIDAEKIGKLTLELGAGRISKEDTIDYDVGISLNKTPFSPSIQY